VQQLICDTSFTLGEQSESASPLDPSFWPVHPTVDRLLQYKRLVNPFWNTHWMDTSAQLPMGTTFCVTTQCKGHHVDDVTTFMSVVQGDDGTFARRYLTNGELFECVRARRAGGVAVARWRGVLCRVVEEPCVCRGTGAAARWVEPGSRRRRAFAAHY
jgi:hypothetical protein